MMVAHTLCVRREVSERTPKTPLLSLCSRRIHFNLQWYFFLNDEDKNLGNGNEIAS